MGTVVLEIPISLVAINILIILLIIKLDPIRITLILQTTIKIDLKEIGGGCSQEKYISWESTGPIKGESQIAPVVKDPFVLAS